MHLSRGRPPAAQLARWPLALLSRLIDARSRLSRQEDASDPFTEAQLNYLGT